MIGAHLNFIPTDLPQPANPWEGVSDVERRRFETRMRELENHRGYATIQRTRIVDKFWAWSDHLGNLENSFDTTPA